MPTARELLDQADALMRRNRLANAPTPEDGIPTLTDAVPAPAIAADAPSTLAAATPSAPTDLEDVPLLTDAVEEIEAPSILDEPPDPDDPDMWTDTLTGAHTIIPAAPLQLPSADDPHAPPVGVLPEEWGASGAHAGPALAIETIDIPAPEPEAADPVAVAPDATAPPPPFESFPAAQAQVDEGAPDAAGAERAPAEPSGASAAFATGDPSPAPLPAGPEETQPATPFEWPSANEWSASASQPASGPEPAAPGAHAAMHVPAPVAAAAEHAPVDDAARRAEEARWSALAEEVRMQVLQRIDLFTDTGLREQLAARLQPIVDRASADLVATINQHVGVLLRAYVAEAIEREIERWRADRG